MFFKIFTDGGARGNPGNAAVGFVVYKIDTEKNLTSELGRTGKTIGFTTNNVAESTAVIEALKWLKKNLGEDFNKEKTNTIEFKLDSKLVASQLGGIFKIKDPKLRTLLVTVYGLVGELNAVASYSYISREKNQDADLEVNRALDAEMI